MCLPCILTNAIYAAVLCRMRIRLNAAVKPANQIVHFRNSQDADTQNPTVIIQPPVINNTAGQRSNKVNRVISYLLDVFSPFIYTLSIVPLREELKSTLRASFSTFRASFSRFRSAI